MTYTTAPSSGWSRSACTCGSRNGTSTTEPSTSTTCSTPSVAELATAVAELRQIAHGLRPSTLDDGLPAALSHLVRGVPMAVDMDVDDGPLTNAVATTAYYVASEAITNAVKHAQATRIVLQVVRRDGQLLIRVTDDGRGGAHLGVRSGLRDRVAAIGGTLRVASPEGHGTEVEAALPCAS